MWPPPVVVLVLWTASAVNVMTPARQTLRQAMLERREVLATSAAAVAFLQVAQVDASGGATAGGVYLLRAKERYNGIVVAGAEDFKKASGAVDAGDVGAVAALFGSKSYSGLEGAGMLLAGSFRINSVKAPDTITQVIKFKAFLKEAEAIQASLKKKKVDKAAYARAVEALDDYLISVELASE